MPNLITIDQETDCHINVVLNLDRGRCPKSDLLRFLLYNLATQRFIYILLICCEKGKHCAYFSQRNHQPISYLENAEAKNVKLSFF